MRAPASARGRLRLLELTGTFLVAAAALTLAVSQIACGDDKCLADGENCSQSYLESNGLEGFTCCNGQTCTEGPTSGVLICRF